MDKIYKIKTMTEREKLLKEFDEWLQKLKKKNGTTAY